MRCLLGICIAVGLGLASMVSSRLLAGQIESLHVAAQQGDLDRIKTLISDGGNVNAPNSRGATALHVAAGAGRREICAFLIAVGGDVGAKDWSGDTPLHWAMRQGRTDVVRVLLEKGADANLQNRGGRTPLEDAVLRGHSEVVNLAVKHDLESTNPPPPRHEVSVGRVSIASLCRKGDTVPVTISVANRGTFRETLRVTLRDQTNGAELAGKTVTLGKKWTGKADDIPDLVLEAGAPGADQMGTRVCIGGDANGDGYRDLLVCSPIWHDERGRAYLYYGGPRIDANADLIFQGQEAGCYLGNQSGAFADLNKDGCDDLIIGAPGRTLDNRHDGYVNMYYGGSNMDAIPDVILNGEAGTRENFGLMVTASDIDNDGYPDVLVGAQGYDGRGRVYLFWGGNRTHTTADVILEGENFAEVNPSNVFNKNRQPPAPVTLFGRRIDAGGDVNGDGYKDIVIGARNAGGLGNNGCAYLFFGNSKERMDGVCDWTFRGEDRNYEMGSSLDMSDIDGDGYADVLVGARGAMGYHGRVYIYWGARDFDGSHPGLILEAPTQSGMGGDCIECGHFNDDRYGDILVGAFGYPGTGYMYGCAYLYCGNARSVMDARCDYLFGGACDTDNYFGCQVSAGDVNGDGYVDALIGESGANQQSGRACLFYGPFHDATDIIFDWDTATASIGRHILSAEVDFVAREQDTEDNVKIVTIDIKEDE